MPRKEATKPSTSASERPSVRRGRPRAAKRPSEDGDGQRRTVTKADLVGELLDRIPDVSALECEALVDATLQTLIEALRAGDGVEVRGFGSFRVRQRGARTGRNPKTGAKVAVPAKQVAYFTPGKDLRTALCPLGPGSPRLKRERPSGA